jgi:hypothetical protein
MIFSLAMFVVIPAKTTNADAASCAAAVADAAEALAEQRAQCSASPSGGACALLTSHLAELMATAANECQ